MHSPITRFVLPSKARLYVRGALSPRPVETLLEILSLSPAEKKLLRGRWYHDFKDLGFSTDHYSERYRLNQLAKQGPIKEFIAQALQLCRSNPNTVGDASGVELFCADGFYTNIAIELGAGKMVGVDINETEIEKARLITRVLGNGPNVEFRVENVFHLEGSYDFGICAGGLYHLENPSRLLKLLRSRIRVALVIQTVFSLARSEASYFEVPAPGRTWGCRFSYDYLMSMVEESGWTILDTQRNELQGNVYLKDRGSAYLLCVPAEGSKGQ